MKRLTYLFAACGLILAGAFSTARAADKWWDLNGTTAGVGNVGGFQDGPWDTTTANWNTDPTGGAAGTIGPWVAGDVAHFYAGTDGADGILTFPSGGQTVGGLEVEEGKLSITGAAAGAINIGGNPLKVGNGATFEISNLNQLTVAAGFVLTLDGGTLSNLITGLGSGVITGTNSQIQLGANGGTIKTPNGGPTGTDTDTAAYSIMVYTNNIALASGVTTATLHKTGHGEFRALTNWGFTSLDIKEGLYRINGTGGTETGFGAATGTVTIAGGAVENTSQGAAIGTSIGITSPNTRNFVLSGVGATLDCDIVLNASWTINGNISGPGGFIINGWQRGDAGAVIGTAQTLTLSGTNTYGGGTTIGYSTLAATGGSAIPDTSRVTISTRSLWGNGTQSTQNTAVLQIGTSGAAATETIGSLSGGNATRGSVNILNSGSTLITGADGTTSTYSGAITGAGGLSKTGGGVFTMDGVKSYTGNTKVLGGTLSTNSLSLADAADVYLTTGNFFNLNFSGTDTIRSLFIDGVQQIAGVWGSTSSGAANLTALITGAGLLNITTGPVVGLPGDFNGDGHLDASDYVSIRKAFSDITTGAGLTAYTAWRTNFANPPGSGSGLSGGAVPEPTTLVFAGLAMFFGLAVRKR